MYEASNTMFDHSEKRYSLLFSYKSEESESKHAAIALSLDNDVYIEVRIYILVYNIILKSLKIFSEFHSITEGGMERCIKQICCCCFLRWR